MRVAIMGAGLSGLTCALTLEKWGIKPTILEKRDQVGDRFVNGEIFLGILHRPISDALSYLADKYKIFLQPTSNIQKLVIFSENKKAEVEGLLGFTSIRGRHPNSLEAQLARQVSSPIQFNSQYSYEDLLKEYTHIIMATGDAAYAVKVKNYQTDLTVSLKGATFEGKFDPYTVYAWLDNRIAPRGYSYLIPYSEQEANGVIAYPDYLENRDVNPDQLWHKFLKRLNTDLGIFSNQDNHFQITNYLIGHCNSPRIANTFFTGNCFGSLMPFLGFGQFGALLTGIYAAQDLLGLKDYEKSTNRLIKSYQNSLVLRRGIEKLNNQGFDSIVESLSGRLGNKIFNTRFNVLEMASYLLRPLIKE